MIRYQHPVAARRYSIQQSFDTGHCDGGGAPFIPVQAAQRYFEAKKLDFLGIDIPGLQAETAHLLISKTL